MNKLQKGQIYSLLENKEHYLITKKGIVYFAMRKGQVSEEDMYNVFRAYEEDMGFIRTLMELHETI